MKQQMEWWQQSSEWKSDYNIVTLFKVKIKVHMTLFEI